MNFLNGLVLWALPAVSFPLLIHLLNRRPPKKVFFSHIEWLKKAHQTLMPRKRLREILLIILRTLIVLFLILFFARPTWNAGTPWKKGEQKTGTIILVDVSASMESIRDGQTAMEIVKEKILRQIPTFSKESQVGLISFSDEISAQLAPTTDRSKLTGVIRDLEIEYRSTNIKPALEVAYSMLENIQAKSKSIFILSDGARNAWDWRKDADPRINGYDPEVGIVLWEIISEETNAGIGDAALHLNEEGSLIGYWDPTQNSRLKNIPWSLQLNGRTVQKGVISSSGDEKIPMSARLPEGGFYSGEISLRSDAQPFDDRFFVAGRIPKGFRLLIIDGETGLAPADSESYYLKTSLESPRDPRLEFIQQIRPEAFLSEDIGNFDALVLANTNLDLEASAEINKWVELGGGLFLSAGNHWGPRGPEGFGWLRVTSQKEGHFSVRPPKEANSLLSSIAELNNFEWDAISVDRYFEVDPNSGLIPLLELENGAPLLGVRNWGKGVVLVWLSSIDRAWTNFPSKPAFSPLIRELVASLADPLREQTALMGTVGSPMKIRMPLGLSRVTVVSPQGTSVGARVNPDGFLEWPSPERPGLYSVRTNDPSKDFDFAVNIPNLISEGDGEQISEGDLKKIFPESAVSILGPSAGSENSVVGTLHGREFSGIIMTLLIIVLILETFLASRLKRNEI